MTKVWLVVVAILAACGGGGHAGDGGTSGSGGWTRATGTPVVMFAGAGSQTIGGGTYRFEDTSSDGDYNEAGEVTLFYSNVDPLAVDSSTVLAFSTPVGSQNTILWLQDLNGDGDAMDPGESHVWFSGSLPSGATLGTSDYFARTIDGSVIVVHKGSGSTSLYLLKDLNGNGNVDDPGDVTLAGQVPNQLVSRRVTVDAAGDVWFTDYTTKDLYRLHAGTTSLMITYASLNSAIGASGFQPHVLASRANGSIVFATNEVIASVKDSNGDGQVTPDEATVVWDQQHGDFFCDMTDVQGLSDGSLIATDSGNIEQALAFRFVDADQDGTYLGRGEMYVVHDSFFAASNGLPKFDGIGAVSAPN